MQTKLSFATNSKIDRLVDWNVEIFSDLLRKVVAVNNASKRPTPLVVRDLAGTTPLSEVQEVLHLPEYDADAVRKRADPNYILLDEDVVQQLYRLVSKIASMYQ